MSNNLKKTISYFVFAFISIALLLFVFKDVDIASMWNDIKHANLGWIAVAFVFAFCAYIFRALRWNLLIESTCDHKPSLKNAFWAEMFGYFANLALPRIGEITRCGALARTERLPFDRLIGTVIVERALDVIVMLLLAALTFCIKIDFFGTFILDKVLLPTVTRIMSLSPIAIIFIIILLFAMLVFFIYLRKSENVISKKIASFFQGIVDGLKSVYKLEKRGLFIVYTFLLWFCYWMMTWLLCFTIPQTANLGMADGLFLLIIGSIGMAVPVQGGIGAYHYIVALGLTIYGFDFNSVGLLYATIGHESQLIGEIILGIISLFFVFKRVENEPIEQSHQ